MPFTFDETDAALDPQYRERPPSLPRGSHSGGRARRVSVTTTFVGPVLELVKVASASQAEHSHKVSKVREPHVGRGANLSATFPLARRASAAS